MVLKRFSRYLIYVKILSIDKRYAFISANAFIPNENSTMGFKKYSYNDH